MKKLIIANWKMNPRGLAEAKDLFQKIRRTARTLRNVQTVVCPPFVFLSELAKLVTGASCVVGAQDVFWKEQGPFTGEVSPLQLERLGVRYAILGHSERRALGESDKDVSRKVKACLANNVIPVLCVGESDRDQQGVYFLTLKQQIKNSLAGVSVQEIPKVVIAYEPVWAVGAKAKHADTPEALLVMTIFIRKVLSDMYGAKNVKNIAMLYGGSVNDADAEGFLKDGGVRGLLVGRASLDPKEFGLILKIAHSL